MKSILYTVTAASLAVLPALAQKYEFNIAGGGSFYQSKTVTNPKGAANAGFSSGYAVSAAIGQNMYKHVGGEFRYTYLQNDLKLTGGGLSAAFGAQAHALHYDLLVHSTATGSKVRPYLAAGGGIKIYRGTGTEVVNQPLGNIALLTKTQDLQGLISVGGGVKFALSEKLMFRIDVHDYITPFPKKVITPNVNSSVSGWLNNIVPTAGIVFTF